MEKLTIALILLMCLIGCRAKEKPEVENSRITRALSPCQCKLSGGCSIMWKISPDRLYTDGTAPLDYDNFGRYVGSMDVPSECR